jgi:hypothetical protein
MGYGGSTTEVYNNCTKMSTGVNVYFFESNSNRGSGFDPHPCAARERLLGRVDQAGGATDLDLVRPEIGAARLDRQYREVCTVLVVPAYVVLIDMNTLDHGLVYGLLLHGSSIKD